MIGQKYHFTVKTVKELLGRAGGARNIASLSNIFKKQLLCNSISYFVVIILELDKGY